MRALIDENTEATRISWQHALDLGLLLFFRAYPNRFQSFEGGNNEGDKRHA